MSYEELINSLTEGTVIDFREYKSDRHERKSLSLSIEGGIIKECFPAHQIIDIGKLRELYGEELDDFTYRALGYSTCPRYLLNLGINVDGAMDVKMITLNKDFIESGFQEVEILGSLDTVNQEPSYLLAQGGIFNE